MITDNPFAEPDDSDRTIIRPMPGGRKPTTTPPVGFTDQAAPFSLPPSPAPHNTPPQPPIITTARAVEAAQSIEMGGGPLLSAAGPLLQLLGRLRQVRTPPNQMELRERALRALRTFEETIRKADIPIEQLRPAHYALCASLDDVVLATPWGSQGPWAQHSLVSTFHQEVRSGERFFDVLRQISQNPARFMPVLELMYFCLALGYMGRYRLTPRGVSEIDKLREDTYALIKRETPPTEAGLSPHWQGVNAPYTGTQKHVPIWVASILALGVIGAFFAQSVFVLNKHSDNAFSLALAAPPAAMPQISRDQPPTLPASPPLAGPTIVQRLSTFLQPEITAGLVSVLGTPHQPMVRINNMGLFASGSATVEASALPLLHKIGTALSHETGLVRVTGYTDTQPIHTLRFPSNFELSRARAEAAGVALNETIGTPDRVATNGMGAGNPIASNTTPAGRGQNRRIEIVLDHLSGN